MFLNTAPHTHMINQTDRGCPRTNTGITLTQTDTHRHSHTVTHAHIHKHTNTTLFHTVKCKQLVESPW